MNAFYCDFGGTTVFGIENNGGNLFHLPDVVSALGIKDFNTSLLIENPLATKSLKDSRQPSTRTVFITEQGIYRLAFKSDASSVAQKILSSYSESTKNGQENWIEDLFPR